MTQFCQRWPVDFSGTVV